MERMEHDVLAAELSCLNTYSDVIDDVNGCIVSNRCSSGSGSCTGGS